ncbi:MAG: hypothetical protein ABI550_01540 [Ignavibacteriaceae bacterium]
MKNKNLAKIFAVSSVLSVFIIHLLIVHIIFQNYIICLENDGSVVVESASEFCCTSTDIFTNSEYTENHNDEYCNFCEDISILENCDKEYLLTARKIPPIIFDILFTNNFFYLINEREQNFSFLLQNENKNSIQLDSYKTVLLLI